jgi:hypothetical protein
MLKERCGKIRRFAAQQFLEKLQPIHGKAAFRFIVQADALQQTYIRDAKHCKQVAAVYLAGFIS